ncbi:zf-TFIIB domain-containing protein [Ottowia sp.]|jgi:Zn-finger nucleic acid-binding protein|uniref:TFIIB-type zinc ribbon-containing protein n=1 Tax=Ottowia sp. TaxID=1898956 RepID=UPI0025FAA98C|nr:zf-TFIIB domain-containing protein [Ottowia sp.]MBK6745602.1 zf-TFIIB domain-containing protein [Ottowia sp.]
MKCPTCDGVNLVMSERSGIEIDYCPQCRGVWLDRGELDKIIERAAPAAAQQPAPQAAPVQQPQQAYRQPPPPHYDERGYYRKKKREGFLGELFDFD